MREGEPRKALEVAPVLDLHFHASGYTPKYTPNRSMLEFFSCVSKTPCNFKSLLVSTLENAHCFNLKPIESEGIYP